jgi:hypothetical protein
MTAFHMSVSNGPHRLRPARDILGEDLPEIRNAE